jgi:hypothetical protein
MCIEGGLVLGKYVVVCTLVTYSPPPPRSSYSTGTLHCIICEYLFTEKKNRANRDEPSKIPTVPDVGKTVPNAVSN